MKCLSCSLIVLFAYTYNMLNSICTSTTLIGRTVRNEQAVELKPSLYSTSASTVHSRAPNIKGNLPLV